MPLRNRCFWMMLAAMVGLAAMGKLGRGHDHALPANIRPQGPALAVGGAAWSPASEGAFLLPVKSRVQSKDPNGLGAGKLLVASRNMGDPNFARTVILLVRYDAEGVLGLILNRRTEVPLSRVLKDFKAAKDRSDTVYLGGPVEMPDVFALLRSPSKVEAADQVCSGVYFISAKDVFEQTISTRPDPAKFHVYLGYAGWAQEQLRKEVELGAWFIFPGDANTVFDADPDSLWSRTIRKTELNFAESGFGGRVSSLHSENALLPL